jgi:hypothetical protein
MCKVISLYLAESLLALFLCIFWLAKKENRPGVFKSYRSIWSPYCQDVAWLYLQTFPPPLILCLTLAWNAYAIVWVFLADTWCATRLTDTSFSTENLLTGVINRRDIKDLPLYYSLNVRLYCMGQLCNVLIPFFFTKYFALSKMVCILKSFSG